MGCLHNVSLFDFIWVFYFGDVVDFAVCCLVGLVVFARMEFT